MPIPLTSIPEHIRSAIVQKIEYRDFVKFHQSSQDCFDISMKVKTRFSMSPRIIDELTLIMPTTKSTRLHLEYANEEIFMQFVLYDWNSYRPYMPNFCEYPVRFENYDVLVFGNFTEEFCWSLINIVKCTNSTIKELRLGEVSCSPDSLNRLIEAAKVQELHFAEPISPDYMRVETIRKTCNFFITDFMNEADILFQTAVDFTVLSSDMTSAGFNQLLKNLLADDETIEKGFDITTNQQILKDVILDGIPIMFRCMFLGELFTIGQGRNLFCLEIEGQTVRLFKHRNIPLPFGLPFGGFPMFPFGDYLNFPFGIPLLPNF